MTADEIRSIIHDAGLLGQIEFNVLREIAAQLAEQNQILKDNAKSLAKLHLDFLRGDIR